MVTGCLWIFARVSHSFSRYDVYIYQQVYLCDMSCSWLACTNPHKNGPFTVKKVCHLEKQQDVPGRQHLHMFLLVTSGESGTCVPSLNAAKYSFKVHRNRIDMIGEKYLGLGGLTATPVPPLVELMNSNALGRPSMSRYAA